MRLPRRHGCRAEPLGQWPPVVEVEEGEEEGTRTAAQVAPRVHSCRLKYLPGKGLIRMHSTLTTAAVRSGVGATAGAASAGCGDGGRSFGPLTRGGESCSPASAAGLHCKLTKSVLAAPLTSASRRVTEPVCLRGVPTSSHLSIWRVLTGRTVTVTTRMHVCLP
jgi:hypothetical protein